jgi:F0F1-type ATP synthase assembly protein I
MIENKEQEKVWSAYSLALTLGYMIIIPIVIFGIGGVLLDKKLNCFPIFTLIGFILSMTSSLLTVYFKTKDIISGGKIKKK